MASYATVSYVTTGAVVSTLTVVDALEIEPADPGWASVKFAALPARSVIVPPFNARAPVEA